MSATQDATIAYDRLSERYFRSIANYIENEVGIRLPPAKRTMVEGRLRKRVRALGFATLDAYVKAVFDEGELERESIHLIDCVTTNKTDFFREPDHFSVLLKETMPRLLSEERTAARPFKFWSAACSIGAEPYTLAMILAGFAETADFSFRILATDICASALEHGRRAVYTEDMLDPVPDGMRRRYVMRSRDPARREGRIVPELRALVRFERLNLMDSAYPIDRDMDVIFCRNVLIYFSPETQQAVVSRLCRHLRPGGYLFLGHSEPFAGRQQSLRQVASTVFQREPRNHA